MSVDFRKCHLKSYNQHKHNFNSNIWRKKRRETVNNLDGEAREKQQQQQHERTDKKTANRWASIKSSPF